VGLDYPVSALTCAFRLCGGLAGAFVLAGEAVEYRFAADSVLGQVDGFGVTGLGLGRGELV
jgi:hypothetical protein